MEYKFNFTTEEEREKIIQENSNLTLIKSAYHLGENYLIFTDKEVVYELSEHQILSNKISILERENKALKEEISQIQASTTSLVSAIQK